MPHTCPWEQKLEDGFEFQARLGLRSEFKASLGYIVRQKNNLSIFFSCVYFLFLVVKYMFSPSREFSCTRVLFLAFSIREVLQWDFIS